MLQINCTATLYIYRWFLIVIKILGAKNKIFFAGTPSHYVGVLKKI